MTTPEEIISQLNLKPLPVEGGFYRETYRSPEVLKHEALPDRYQDSRPLCTAIYYLITPVSFSYMHRLRSDEVFHFYMGDPVEMLQLYPDGSGKVVFLGSEIHTGMELQTVVPQGVWQGARLSVGGNFALLGTTVAPGFAPDDFELARREELMLAYPEYREMIVGLTDPGS